VLGVDRATVIESIEEDEEGSVVAWVRQRRDSKRRCGHWFPFGSPEDAAGAAYRVRRHADVSKPVSNPSKLERMQVPKNKKALREQGFQERERRDSNPHLRRDRPPRRKRRLATMSA
jgi:hypothetical protein